MLLDRFCKAHTSQLCKSILLLGCLFLWHHNQLIIAQTVNDIDQEQTTTRPDDLFDESEPSTEFVVTEKWAKLLPQRAAVTSTWLSAGGDEGLGMTGLNLAATFGGPAPWLKSAVSLSPSFDVQFLDAPRGVELPSTLYRGSLNFSVMKPLSEKMQVMLGISPGFSSDLETGSSDAFRMMAFAAANWQYRPTLKLNFGVAATGREDIPVMPMAGLTWTPTEDWKIDIGAPRPQIARRINCSNCDGSDWIYIAGEFGGGTWAVNRAGRDDELTIRDFRLLLGWERKSTARLNLKLEAGYVFGRKIEYETDDFEYEPTDTVMLRAGLSF